MQKQPRGCKEFKVMSEEMNDKSGMYNSGSGRDGYKSRDVENNRNGRTGRPRINSAGRVWSDRTPSRGSYGAGRRQRTDGSEGQRGYRPSGDDASRSRYGAPHAGGYRSNASYNNNGGGAFRPSFTRADDMPTGGDWGGRPNGGGFRPRFQAGGAGGGFRNGGNRAFGPGRTGRFGNYDPHAKYSHKKRMEYKEENIDPNAPIRLNRYLANAGVCSRRDADKYIEAGVVQVNGQVVTELGTKVLRSDEVKFHDQVVKIEKKVYVLLNKPKGYVTTSEDPQNRKTVMDLVRDACPERIYPVGRLDQNTTGVLLLTNDGDMASKLTHPKFLKKKIYHVFTDKNVTAADIRQIAEGITLEDGEIHADGIEYASPTDKKQVGIEIHSGKNRIVRRIFESLGYHVIKLDRVYFAGLTKKGLRRGDWRFLTEKEVQMLRMGAYE